MKVPSHPNYSMILGYFKSLVLNTFAGQTSVPLGQRDVLSKRRKIVDGQNVLHTFMLHLRVFYLLLTQWLAAQSSLIGIFSSHYSLNIAVALCENSARNLMATVVDVPLLEFQHLSL